MNVNSVASVLAMLEALGSMKEFTVEKNHINVNSVTSVLAKKEV